MEASLENSKSVIIHSSDTSNVSDNNNNNKKNNNNNNNKNNNNNNNNNKKGNEKEKNGKKEEEEFQVVDEVKLGEEGWKERYYTQKFHIRMDDKEFFDSLKFSYLQGLVWVLRYYYQGCSSWKWFFPFHYAPFASELHPCAHIEKQVKESMALGTPFAPFEQLMGVLPASSGVHIPAPYRPLMTDEDSPILDFYPTSFTIDMNGATAPWLGVVLLPFIEENRLLEAMKPYADQLNEEGTSYHTIIA